MPSRTRTVLLLAALALTGCGSAGRLGRAGEAPGGAKWTVMVFMDADGDLEEYGILNMNQMESVGSDANVNLVVEMDRTPGYDTSNGDWTGTRRYLVTRDNDMRVIHSPLVEDPGEVDMGRPGALRDFIAWSAARYPAQRYALVVWNHGSGWRPKPETAPAAGVPARSRGILFDDTSNTYLTMADFDAGLEAPGVRPDLIALDASLMGMLEVCYEIRDRTDIIVSSEESPPGPGYPYHRILGLLKANPEMTPQELGRAFVSEYVGAYRPDPVTQAAIDTRRLPDLAADVDRFASALADALPEHRAAMERARAQTQAYAYPYYRDLAHFAENVRNLVPNPTVAEAAGAVLEAMAAGGDRPILFEAHAGTSTANSHGLSIYLPKPGELFAGYGDLRFCRDFPAWQRLIEKWLQ